VANRDELLAATTQRVLSDLARNAYRSLGLPGDASQADVRGALATWRRATKLQLTKQCAWDLPWLGTISRAEADINDALGRIRDPARRLRERLFWFHEGGEVVGDISPDSINSVARGWASAPRLAARHDAAVLRLLAATCLDPEVEDQSRWLQVLREWHEVVTSEDYWTALVKAESQGEFEPAATLEEIGSLRAEAMKLVAGVLGTIAKDALSHGELGTCRNALEVLRSASLPADVLSELESDILGPAEDDLLASCGRMGGECVDEVKREEDSTAKRSICEAAVARFDAEVEPALNRLLEAGGPDSGFALRARQAAAECLLYLAFGWTWARDFVQAKTLEERALRTGAGTAAEARITEELSQIAVQAQQQDDYEKVFEGDGCWMCTWRVEVYMCQMPAPAAWVTRILTLKQDTVARRRLGLALGSIALLCSFRCAAPAVAMRTNCS